MVENNLALELTKIYVDNCNNHISCGELWQIYLDFCDKIKEKENESLNGVSLEDLMDYMALG